MNPSEKPSLHIGKTIFDYTISLFCLILLAPVILFLSIVIKTTGKGSVIYKQNRIGKNGIPFMIYKFRSMNNVVGEDENLLSAKNDTRITGIGRFMRKHKLDEIPNFINVLKGDMSLVGPRPEQPYFINQIVQRAPEYKLLHTIKPGITSWGQVKYGYATDVDQMIRRLEYDLYYLKNRSLGFDLKILLLTVVVIIRGEGV